MATSHASPALPGNHLLTRLPKKDYERILLNLRLIPLEAKSIFNEPHSPITYVYFPLRGVISSVTVMEDGSSIEVATIGNEGLVGISAMLSDEESQNRIIVQVPGEAMRMRQKIFRLKRPETVHSGDC
jgi:CRP-like cAMP-binding protein